MIKYIILFILFFITQKLIIGNIDNNVILISTFKIILLSYIIDYISYLNGEEIIF